MFYFVWLENESIYFKEFGVFLFEEDEFINDKTTFLKRNSFSSTKIKVMIIDLN